MRFVRVDRPCFGEVRVSVVLFEQRREQKTRASFIAVIV
jgi:hypothetical protein